LTPTDVRNKHFSTTRNRPGYDEEDVDTFLDLVERELDLLIKENGELRAALARMVRGEGTQSDIPPLPVRELRAADVHNVKFSTTRLRPGYDEEEVDAFLDDLEAEIERLLLENGQLRARLTEGTFGWSFGWNLTRDAREGLLDPVFGRWPEIQQVISALASPSERVPLLVGEHGVGMSAVVRGVVLASQRPGAPDWLAGADVWEFDAHRLMQADSGGPPDAQVASLEAHARSIGNAVVLFVENAFAPMTASRDQSRPITYLESALIGGGVRIIAAATPAEYRASVLAGSPLEARLQVIEVDELPEKTAVDVLRDVRDRWESQYQVSLTDEAIAAAVALSVRHALDGRPLAGKAMDLIDRAAALASARTVFVRLDEVRVNMPDHRVVEVTEVDVADALAAHDRS
jgi:DivIVA domain-containing protein